MGLPAANLPAVINALGILQDVKASPARTCENCHTRPKTIGYGTMNSRSAGELLKDVTLFGNNAAGVYGDIPDAKTGRWQTPKMPNFPFAWDQLVTRSRKTGIVFIIYE